MTRVHWYSVLMSDVFLQVRLRQLDDGSAGRRGTTDGLAYATSTKGFIPFSVFTNDIKALLKRYATVQ